MQEDFVLLENEMLKITQDAIKHVRKKWTQSLGLLTPTIPQ